MKGKSSRHQSSDHQNNDDWVDGSWTVDCICGVNFDDGEEMVDCDECGVWVHTRCSGYDKGDKMFMCDKCKGSYNNNNNNNIDRSGGENGEKNNEETEVAQLLVDLPNKTVRMGRKSSSSGVVGDDGAGTTRRQYKLWTDIPMEERVHVQGVPGGDPGLFSGLSKVFSPQLWKSTGYVPKKFNFQYKEFPCWDDDDEVEVGGNESPDDKGAGVLFSLAKENVLPSSPGVDLVGMGVGVEGRGTSKNASSKEAKKLNLEDSDVRQSQNVKRERTLLRPPLIQSSNKKKEDLGTTKDFDGRKNAPAPDREADIRKSGAHSSPKAFAPCSEAKQVEFCEDRGVKTFKASTQSVKNLKLRDNATREPIKTYAMDKMDEKIKSSSAVNKYCPDDLSFDKSRTCLGDAVSKDSAGNQATTPGSSVGPAQSVTEGDKKAVDDMGRREGFTNNPEKTPEGGLASTASEVKCCKAIQDVDNDKIAGSASTCIRVKTELDHRSGTVLDIQSTIPTEAKHRVITSDQMSENQKVNDVSAKVNDVSASCSQSSNPKPIKAGRNSEETRNSHIGTHCVSTVNTHQVKQDIDGSDCPVVGQKVALEVTKGFGNSSALPTQQKPLTSVVKSSSSSSTNVISRSSTSDISKPADTQIPSPITMEQVTSKFNARNKKTSSKDLVSCEEMHDFSRKVANSSGNSTDKVKYTSKISQTYVSKRSMSATKDSAVHSSGKVSRRSVAVTSGSSDSAGSLKNQNETNLEGRTSSSVSVQRGERINQSNIQPSSNLNQALTRPPSHTPAALSDEELALLLHQELNSSPRVPRVRHAGSLPHLASSTSKSMLIKRSSSSGGKDHNSFSRRRNKDVKDGYRSRDLEGEVKRAERRIPPSPDQRRRGKEVLSKRNDNSSSSVVHTRKSIPSSSNPANSGPSSSEANDHNSSTVHNSPRRNLDDDSGTITVPVYRTLPRLISEIMSKGKRMTYEELCNAVLPHWHSLRKHNGERYAYSSHSQAVLDCLRNRHEWAQLVDRGPKTTSSKKRRMIDTEESDDDEYMKDITVKESDGRSFESQREDYSKGKRKSRRRRRLALQGRGIRDVRKRRKTDMLSGDDEDGSLPDSSEDSMFNEYDSRGSSGAQPVVSEASASSD